MQQLLQETDSVSGFHVLALVLSRSQHHEKGLAALSLVRSSVLCLEVTGFICETRKSWKASYEQLQQTRM